MGRVGIIDPSSSMSQTETVYLIDNMLFHTLTIYGSFTFSEISFNLTTVRCVILTLLYLFHCQLYCLIQVYALIHIVSMT